MTWIAAFAWTLGLEQPVYVLALRGRARNWWEPSVWTLAVNLMTHPLLWVTLTRVDAGEGGVIAAELAVALFEGAATAMLLERRGTPRRDAAFAGMGTAFAANLFSWLAGGALLPLLLVPRP